MSISQGQKILASDLSKILTTDNFLNSIDLNALKESLGISANPVSLIGVMGVTVTITWKNYNDPSINISSKTITLPANTQYVTLSGFAASTLYPGQSCSGSCSFNSSKVNITLKYTTSNTITVSGSASTLGGYSGTSTHTAEINCFG